MMHGLEQQKAAVQSRLLAAVSATIRTWPKQGKNPLQTGLARRRASPLDKYVYNETRYTMLAQSNPEAAKRLLAHGAGGRERALAVCTSTGRPCRATGKRTSNCSGGEQ